MPPLRGRAVALRDIGARKGAVAPDAQPFTLEGGSHLIDQPRLGRGAIAIPQNHLRTARAETVQRLARHRMHVDQNRPPEFRLRLRHQPFKRVVIRRPDPRDPRLGLGAGELAAIDRPASRHHPRDHAKPGHDPRAPMRRHAQILDHACIQLIRAAIEVDIGPRIARHETSRPDLGCPGQKPIDKRILRGPQPPHIQHRARPQVSRVVIARMRRGKDRRSAQWHRHAQPIGQWMQLLGRHSSRPKCRTSLHRIFPAKSLLKAAPTPFIDPQTDAVPRFRAYQLQQARDRIGWNRTGVGG